MTLQLVEAVKGLNQDIPSGPIMLKAIDNNDGTYRVPSPPPVEVSSRGAEPQSPFPLFRGAGP